MTFEPVSDIEIINRINDATQMRFGRAYIEEIARIVNDLTQADYTFITKIDHDGNRAIPLVSLKGGTRIEDVSYPLTDTPCLTVTDTCVGYYPSGVQGLFPDDHYLQDLGVEGYIGVAVVPLEDEPPVGIITCLYRNASEYSEQYLKIIELIANLVQARIEKEMLLHRQEIIQRENEDQKRELRYSNTLLKEIHHRLKNNLHVLSGILKLQALESQDPQVENQLNEAVERVRAMALIHEKIYGADKLYEISLVEYIRDLIGNIAASNAPSLKLELNVDSEVTLIRPDPLASLAMIINELTINSLKYGFRDRSEGKITIRIDFDESGKNVKMRFCDNGMWLDAKNDQSLGMSLVEIFTEQLRGSYTLDISTGTCYMFTFPREKVVLEELV